MRSNGRLARADSAALVDERRANASELLASLALTDLGVALLILERQVAELTPASVPTVSEAVTQVTARTRVITSGHDATSPGTDDSGVLYVANSGVLYVANSSFETRVDPELVVEGRG